MFEWGRQHPCHRVRVPRARSGGHTGRPQLSAPWGGTLALQAPGCRGPRASRGRARWTEAQKGSGRPRPTEESKALGTRPGGRAPLRGAGGASVGGGAGRGRPGRGRRPREAVQVPQVLRGRLRRSLAQPWAPEGTPGAAGGRADRTSSSRRGAQPGAPRPGLAWPHGRPGQLRRLVQTQPPGADCDPDSDPHRTDEHEGRVILNAHISFLRSRFSFPQPPSGTPDACGRRGPTSGSGSGGRGDGRRGARPASHRDGPGGPGLRSAARAVSPRTRRPPPPDAARPRRVLRAYMRDKITFVQK